VRWLQTQSSNNTRFNHVKYFINTPQDAFAQEQAASRLMYACCSFVRCNGITKAAPVCIMYERELHSHCEEYAASGLFFAKASGEMSFPFPPPFWRKFKNSALKINSTYISCMETSSGRSHVEKNTSTILWVAKNHFVKKTRTFKF